MNSKLFQLGIDPIYIIAIIAAISIVALVLSVIVNYRTIKMWHRYDRFMRGRDAETMEELINQLAGQTEALRDDVATLKFNLKNIPKDIKSNIKKVAIRKYNAFADVGGKLSFSLVMLDGENNGFIITCMHSNGPSYTYIKEVIGGETYVSLSAEESEALKEAMESDILL